MSFSSEVKEELYHLIGKSRHCMIAELSALLAFSGKYTTKDEKTQFFLDTENEELTRKYFTLLNKTISINGYDIRYLEGEKLDELLMATHMKNNVQEFSFHPLCVDNIILQQPCCKRAFLRGAFLATGSVTDPNKSYHFEIVSKELLLAQQVENAMHFFDIDAKIVERKQHYVVYIKEGSQIVDMLAVIGANVALLNYENVRIVKDMRNSVNRKVNCETANISKTVNAAVRQMEDIQLIAETRGLSSLPVNLQEIAKARLEYSDMSLKDLGECLDPPVGKSGVNHRLRRIGEIADYIRGF